MEYINTVQFAELKGCTVQYARRFFKEQQETITQNNPVNNRPQSLLPVSALPEPLQKKYYGKLAADAQLCLPKVQETAVPQKPKHTKPVVKKEFGEFNADEREQITFWTDLLREWQIRRREYENCSEGDMVFIAETKRLRRAYLADQGITLSRDILYRKYKAYKDGDLQGLVDGRGGWNKGNSVIPAEVTECFYALYLSDSKLPVSDCFRLTRDYVFEEFPEYLPFMASERTFRRLPDRLPPAVIKFFREGEKACIDDCLPYIERLYDGIEANDVWVADNHTLDFITKTDYGEKTHRLYVTGILDAKTGVLVGWNITETPNSHSTVMALRHGIQRCGIPKILYVDNIRRILTRIRKRPRSSGGYGAGYFQ